MSGEHHDDRIGRIEARLNALEVDSSKIHERLTELYAAKDSLQGQVDGLAQQVAAVLRPHEEGGEQDA
jgi:hypothetical protein